MARIDIKSLTKEERLAQLTAEGFPAFRARQVNDWLDRGVSSFREMLNLPQALRCESSGGWSRRSTGR